MARQKMPGILIVEDDSDFHHSMRLCLAGKSKLFFASTQREAMRILETEYVDIALVDIKLQSGNGIAVAKKVKEDNHEVTVILMSGALRQLQNHGFIGMQCIEKSDPADLMAGQVLNFWKLQSLPDALKEKRESVQRKLYYDGKVEVVYRRERPGYESLVGLVPGNRGESACHYIKWLAYKYPQHPGVIDIGVTPTLGCTGRCQMCLSGRSRPFIRKFSPEEILSQVAHGLDSAYADGYLTGKNKISVNWTCEGEFSDNVENSCKAIEILAGIEELAARVIITTIGRKAALDEFMLKWIHLPVDFYWSVHTVDSQKREWLMPGTKGQSLEKVRDTFAEFSRRTGRRITAAMSLAKGFNDAEADVEAWADFFKGYPVDTKVMIMVDHCLPDYTGKISEQDAIKIVDALNFRGIPSRLREIMGSEALSGCGTTVPDFDRLIVSTKKYYTL